jgi:hypothetical protein
VSGTASHEIDAAVHHLRGQQAAGERIDLRVDDVRAVVVRTGRPGVAGTEETVGHERTVLVTSRLGTSEGRAVALRPDVDGLQEALADARATRVHPLSPPCAPAVAVPDEVSVARLRRSVAELATQPDVVVTAGGTDRRVRWWSGDGRQVRSASAELQVHLRSARTSLAAAQAAWLGTSWADLDPARLTGEFERAYGNLSAPPVRVEGVDWLLLAPLATARVLSRVVPSLRAAATRADRPPGEPVAPAGVTLARASLEAPLGGGDEPAALLRAGRAAPVPDPDPEGSVWYLAATTERTLDEPYPAGRGVVVERVAGFRGGLDMRTSRLQFEVEGMAVVDGRPLGTATSIVTAAPGQLLRSVRQVGAGPAPFRIGGLFGGSWCLLEGLDCRPKR